MAKKKRSGKKPAAKTPKLPPEVEAIRRALKEGFDSPYPADELKRKVGSVRFGVYAFIDYDGEPIYVGQTYELLRARVGRHLTNQRTDAVAMHVLDPFEVLKVRLWPFFDLHDDVYDHPAKSTERGQARERAKAVLIAAEYQVFRELLAASSFGAVLNEKDIPAVTQSEIELPEPMEFQIVTEGVFESRKHPDLRIARRAATIARLAQVISERDVSKGLRRTLVTQAKRLLSLSEKRFKDVRGDIPLETGKEDSIVTE